MRRQGELEDTLKVQKYSIIKYVFIIVGIMFSLVAFLFSCVFFWFFLVLISP